MKRILLIAIMMMAGVSVQALAQVRFGITGGVGWDDSKLFDYKEKLTEKAPMGWHAGLTMAVDLPMGFSLQPSLVYSHKEALLTDNSGLSMSYIELPVSVQWGPDLLVFRPFLDCTPYLGYAVSNISYLTGDATFENKEWAGKQRLEYGLGLGGGLEIWRFQIVARYNWNFGNLYGEDGTMKDAGSMVDDVISESGNFRGVTLGISYFF